MRPGIVRILIVGLPALTCLILGMTVSAQSQSETTWVNLDEIVFTEIQLGPDGVMAIDTADQEWHYDFDLEMFTPDNGGTETYQTELLHYTYDLPVAERCVVPRDVQPFETKILIREDEYVAGDVNAWGKVIVKGWVQGDVISRERVVVRSTGQVDGDIEAPQINVRPGGIVLGEQRTKELPEFSAPFSASGLVVVLSLAGLVFFFCLIMSSLMSRQSSNIENCLATYRLRTFFIGLLSIFLLPVAIVVVAITIVGIVITPLVPILFAVAMVQGIAVYSGIIGKALSRRLFGSERTSLVRMLLGLALLTSFWLVVAILLGSGDEVSQGFGVFFLVVSIVITAFAMFSGIGAVILTRFGFRKYASWRDRQSGDSGGSAPTPAPPPIPNTPRFTAGEPPSSDGRPPSPPPVPPAPQIPTIPPVPPEPPAPPESPAPPVPPDK